LKSKIVINHLTVQRAVHQAAHVDSFAV